VVKPKGGDRAGDTPVRPLAIDLFCGLGGWTEGLLAEGYRVVGFDNERHAYGNAKYPAHLVLQDVLTIHGSQFKDAALIVASPPCQAYSYRAMPWKKAKALGPPDNSLFEACFRIQREAEDAAGRPIPLVVENVCGAQKWVGRARWHYGSFYLWGDVPALMPIVVNRRMNFPAHCGPRLWSEREYVRLDDGNASAFHHEGATKVGGFSWSDYGKPGYKAQAFNGQAEQRLKATENDGGSWFKVAHNTTSGKGQNPDGCKTSGHLNIRDGHAHTKHLTNPAEHVKNGGDWFGAGPDSSLQRRAGSKSNARKAASAHIAKIPLPLARWIARAWYPTELIEALR